MMIYDRIYGKVLVNLVNLVTRGDEHGLNLSFFSFM